MKLHELKYEVRKRRGKPEGEAKKKLYNIITDSRFTVSLYDIHHMRVLKNGTVAQFASTFRNIIIWIETDTLQMPGFPPDSTLLH